MPNDEDIKHQLNLLAINRRSLAHLVQQAARHGGESEAPTHVFNSLADTRASVARLKDILRDWGVHVDDDPNDVAPPPPDPSVRERQPVGGTSVNIYGGTFSGPVAQTGGSSQSNTFNQTGWTVQGNVYNIAGDMNVSATSSKDEFLAALRQFKSEIDKAQDLPPDEADDLKSNLDAATRAIDRPQPNKERAIEKLSTMQTILEKLKGSAESALALGKLIGQVLLAAQGITF
jgi:hypothetical protein